MLVNLYMVNTGHVYNMYEYCMQVRKGKRSQDWLQSPEVKETKIPKDMQSQNCDEKREKVESSCSF